MKSIIEGLFAVALLVTAPFVFLSGFGGEWNSLVSLGILLLGAWFTVGACAAMPSLKLPVAFGSVLGWIGVYVMGGSVFEHLL